MIATESGVGRRPTHETSLDSGGTTRSMGFTIAEVSVRAWRR